MLKDSLEEAGSQPTIIEVPKGTDFETTLEKVKGVQAGLIVMMLASRYDTMSGFEYNYHFNLAVSDRGGNILVRKDFQHFDVYIPMSGQYTIFDMYAELYKKKFDVILNDPEIQKALADAGQS